MLIVGDNRIDEMRSKRTFVELADESFDKKVTGSLPTRVPPIKLGIPSSTRIVERF